MKPFFLIASIFIAVYSIAIRATAQNVYKCGTTYSQSPCPGGVALDVNDPRSATQKSEADAATRRDATSANAMEKARLKEEAALLKARQPAPKPKAAKEPAAPRRPAAKTAKNKKPADYFVAVVPGEKTQKAPKKKTKTPRDSGESR